MKKLKTGRNKPCPCGSGKKYKRCCGLPFKPLPQNTLIKIIEQKNKEMDALRKQRIQQQGLGKPIISAVTNETRTVFVGNKGYSSKNWLTFHDFLRDFLKIIFGQEWWKSESFKPQKDQHQILLWIDKITEFYSKYVVNQNNSVQRLPSCGAIKAYMTLSYSLYLIMHNTDDHRAHDLLVHRLKHPSFFQGAYYEAFVAANFIKAGFAIQYEDETDSRSTHHEFIAVSKKTGKKYAVEAKSRCRQGVLGCTEADGTLSKKISDFASLLYKALKKDSVLERIISIDVNLPDTQLQTFVDAVYKLLDEKEDSLRIRQKPAPPCYIIVTNYPYHYFYEESCDRGVMVAYGFKIDSFKRDSVFSDLREAINAKEKHQDIFDLIESMDRYQCIPSTFDGSIEEFSLSNLKDERLKIGHKYVIPDGQGNDTIAELTHAVVDTNGKKIYATYYDASKSRTIIATDTISGSELEISKRYPDTFFGVEQQQGRQLKHPIDAYEFFLENYQNAPRKMMLDFLRPAPNYNDFEKLPDNELVKIYVEHLVYALEPNEWSKDKTED